MNKLYYFNADLCSPYPWKLLKDNEFYFFDNIGYFTKSQHSEKTLDSLKLIMNYD